MEIIVIEDRSSLTKHLQAAGFSVQRFSYREVPSVTALLLSHTNVCGMVIQDQSSVIWSGAHILAAAKQLSVKGHTVIVGGGKLTEQCKSSPLVSVCTDITPLADLLKRPIKKAPAGKAGLQVKPKPAALTEQKAEVPEPVKPLKIPADKILFVAVLGSQPRVGCTTQAVGLWHYLKALGFDPAIASSAEQIAQIVGAMHNEQIEGGYKVEGIPFVTDTALAYDCYILDLGSNVNLEEVKRTADCIILVAGSKPWELQNTAAAARAVRGSKHRILLSFTTKENAEKLMPVFAGELAIAAPWIPDIWDKSPTALQQYEYLLRDLIVDLLEMEIPHQGLQPQ